MLQNIEFGFLYFIQTLHVPWLDGIMITASALGDYGLIWIVSGVAFLCFEKTRVMGFAVLISLFFGLLIGNGALKNLIVRPRPCWIDTGVPLLVSVPKDFSFPSGHTMASFESAFSIYFYHKKWGIWAFCLAVLIAFSRMYLFLHFPSDILGGILLGTAIAYGIRRGMLRFMLNMKITGRR